MNTQSAYHVITEQGQQIGPFPLEVIQTMVNTGSLKLDSLCWSPDFGQEWRPVSSLLQTQIPPPAPVIKASANRHETVIWEGRPSWLGLIELGLVAVIVCVAAIWPAIAYGRDEDGFVNLALIIVPVTLLVCAITAMKIRARYYKITNKKVVLEDGLFFRDVQEVELKDVRAISMRWNQVASLFGVGTMVVSSAGTADSIIVFPAIENVKKIRELILRAKEESV